MKYKAAVEFFFNVKLPSMYVLLLWVELLFTYLLSTLAFW